MTTLELILDQLIARVPGGIGRYTRELARHLVTTAPPEGEVEGIVSAISGDRVREIEARVPGLARIRRLPLERRLLARAWELGLPPEPGGHGSVHGTSLLAPLRERRTASGRRRVVVATIHDVVPWSHPETLTPRGVGWHRAMAERAQRFADAVVVPSHAVAAGLAEILDFGDRIRVVPGAASNDLVLPVDHDARAAALRLPERFVLAVGTLEPRKGLRHLIEAFARPEAPDVPLLIAGPSGWGGIDVAAMAAAEGVPTGRVRALGHVSEEDLAVLYDRATAFVMPSLAEGFGLPVVEAFVHGTPVVHSDAPALDEVAGGAGLRVTLAGPDGYATRLAQAVGQVVDDPALAARLASLGRDRATAFDWSKSASRVWALHRELGAS
ncbi:glycosyltransferase family 1 protein [Agromyces sp. Soil535]|uniref:glycosyltransferase family 4 protein n=1 Tax=Agromyces sp. Soil535 TaxID=1736390 RepID=UPI0006F71C84|nr:glycosyltransferase family 1 protein [Agromyces sp. Soil535]KRE26030.1 mannosyltransferase [Agromyces sp. Soil535]